MVDGLAVPQARLIMSMGPQGDGSGAAMGITAKTTSAGIIESIGPRTKYFLLEVPGRVSSLRKFLSPSAMGWSSPNHPTRLGPLRS